MTLIPVYQGSMCGFLFEQHIYLFLCTHDQKSHHCNSNKSNKSKIKSNSNNSMGDWHSSFTGLGSFQHKSLLFLLYLCVSNCLYILSLTSFLKAFLCLLKDMLILPFHIVFFSAWDCNFLLMIMIIIQIRYCLITSRWLLIAF